jgi:hypothetical protein
MGCTVGGVDEDLIDTRRGREDRLDPIDRDELALCELDRVAHAADHADAPLVVLLADVAGRDEAVVVDGRRRVAEVALDDMWRLDPDLAVHELHGDVPGDHTIDGDRAELRRPIALGDPDVRKRATEEAEDLRAARRTADGDRDQARAEPRAGQVGPICVARVQHLPESRHRADGRGLERGEIVEQVRAAAGVRDATTVDEDRGRVHPLAEVRERLEREMARRVADLVARDHRVKRPVRAHRALRHARRAAREEHRVEIVLVAGCGWWHVDLADADQRVPAELFALRLTV